MDEGVAPAGVGEEVVRAGVGGRGSRGRSRRGSARRRARGRGRRTRRSSAGGYSAPVGLFGVTRTMARVRGVRRARAAVGVGEHAVAAGQRDGLDAGHVEPHLVVEVPGHRQHHRVAGRGEGGDRGAEGLVAAGGDRHLVGLDRAAVEPRSSARRSRSAAPGRRGPGRRGGCRARRGSSRPSPRAGLGRRVDRGGLAEVDQRAAVGEVDAGEPAAGLHHRRRGGAGDSGLRRVIGGSSCAGVKRVGDGSATVPRASRWRWRGIRPGWLEPVEDAGVAQRRGERLAVAGRRPRRR